MESTHLSDICVGRCNGVCCDPWWAIISYCAVKKHGASGMEVFEAELVKGIKERAKRVGDNYVTTEKPARSLFGQPDKYNAIVKGIKTEGTSIRLDLIAMFAFRCAFLSKDKTCSIHPAVLGGVDIRPGRCAQLGSPAAMPGEEGFCRIIHAAQRGDAAVDEAVQMEKSVALKYLKEGFDSPEEAAASVVKSFVGWVKRSRPGKDDLMGALRFTHPTSLCERNAQSLAPERKKAPTGRNDPCPCGSGRKYKKCCGTTGC
ncbi:MAG: SEC-C domain-containing protein [Deltaproteobacteria bacterium]|nr:SEC-C domain-containing protein [Deltaproteobacteria bacterium]